MASDQTTYTLELSAYELAFVALACACLPKPLPSDILTLAHLTEKFEVDQLINRLSKMLERMDDDALGPVPPVVAMLRQIGK